jgi:hypothetical protein
MTDSKSQNFPPGWYPDPQSPAYRWWDGQQWTDNWAPTSNTQPSSSRSAAPLAIAPMSATRQLPLRDSSAPATRSNIGGLTTAPRNRFSPLRIGLAVFAVGVTGSILIDALSGSSGNESRPAIESPTDPSTLATSLELTTDAEFEDALTYSKVTESEFQKMLYPSGNLEEFPYPFVGQKIVLYGEVDESAHDSGNAVTFIEATTSWRDLGPLVSWRDCPSFG